MQVYFDKEFSVSRGQPWQLLVVVEQSGTRYCSFSKHPAWKTTLYYHRNVQWMCQRAKENMHPTPLSGMDKQVTTITSRQNMCTMCPLLGYRGNSYTETAEQNLNRKWRRFHSELRHREHKMTGKSFICRNTLTTFTWTFIMSNKIVFQRTVSLLFP